MSEQKEEKIRPIAIIATVVVAMATAVVLAVMAKGTPETTADSADFVPTQELVNECGENARELVLGNYRIVRLFVCEGLAHKSEPYGNRPEDGLYTVVSDEFKTYEDIESLVKSVFIEKEANRILTRMPCDPAADISEAVSSPEFIAVYAPRDVYADASEDISEAVIGDAESGRPTYVKKTVLGISEYFKPNTNYMKPWGSFSIKIVPVNEEECHITVYLGANKGVDLSSVEDADILSTKMVKLDGEWRLTELVY